VFHCLWVSALYIVMMLEFRVARCVHCDEDVACQATFSSSFYSVHRITDSIFTVPLHSASFYFTDVNVKVEFSLEQATMAQRGNKGIVLLFH
jgi:hypothetical protein